MANFNSISKGTSVAKAGEANNASSARKNFNSIEKSQISRAVTPSLATERADERDKMLTPSVSRQAGKTSAQTPSAVAARANFSGNRPTTHEPTLGERLGKIVTGAAKSTGAGYVNNSGTAIRGEAERQKQQNAGEIAAWQDTIKAYQDVLSDPASTQIERETATAVIADLNQRIDAYGKAYGTGGANERAANTVWDAADRLADSANADIERAQEGLGAVGKLLTGAGVAGTQMAIDMLTAPPGATLVPMFFRASGGAAQQARRNGADFDTANTVGGITGAVEVLTEKMFDGLAGVYGGGAADDLVAQFISKHTSSPAFGRLLSYAASAAGESAEEVVAGLVDPAIQSIYNKKSYGENFDPQELLESAIIGGLLGLVGGNTMYNNVLEADAAAIEAENEAAGVGEGATERALEMLTGRTTVRSTPAAAQNAQESTQRVSRETTAPVQNGVNGVSAQIIENGVIAVNNFAETLDTAGANTLKRFYDADSGNAKEYVLSMMRYYNAGKESVGNPKININSVSATESEVLNAAQKEAMFIAGQADAQKAKNSTNLSLQQAEQSGTIKNTDSEFDQNGAPVYAKSREEANVEAADFSKVKEQRAQANSKYGIDAGEGSSLANYISTTFRMLNKRLNNGEIGENDTGVVNRVASALKKFPTFTGRTYRNLKFGSEEAFNAFLSEHASGNTVKLKAFTSTSKRPNGYPLFGGYVVHMVIDGKSGADIADTYGIPRQQEVILLPGTNIKVTSVGTASDGNPIIYAQEVAANEVGRDYENGRPARSVEGNREEDRRGEPFDTGNGEPRGAVREASQDRSGGDGVLSERGERTGELNDSLGSARGGFDPYSKLQNEYGTIPEGEKPFRVADVPKKSTDGRKVSQTVRTVLEAEATPNKIIPNIEQLIVDNQFSYDTITNKETLEAARAEIENLGWETAKQNWFSDMRKNKVSPDLTARGWVFYNNAANSGDTELALKVLDAMVKHQRDAARALQATRILKSLSPETVLYGVRKSVASLQEDLNKQYGKNDAPKLTIDQQLAQEYMDAKTDAEKDAALEKIYRDIGRQMPSRFIDKWNAWRYLAMLGNARTHVRNIIGNAGFAPVVLTKDAIATAVEAVALRGNGDTRTKAFINFASKADRELLSAAWGNYQSANKEVMEGGKYSDAANANRAIEEGRVIFGRTRSDIWNKTGGQLLETARKGNSKALDVEDQWFSQPHFAYALAQYAKANGITAEQIRNGNIPDAARAYAIKEAQKATYRDTNQFSQYISGLGRTMRSGESTPRKIAGTVLEGILPFRKTPANILARGVEYSPLGLMNGIKTLSLDMAKVKSNGEKNGLSADAIAQQQAAIAVDGIDKLAAGLTGTGLLALGAFFASQGLLRGRGGGDDDKREFEELGGHQGYALELPDGTSVTLDWLAPEALALFVGANLYEAQQERAKNGEAVTLSDTLTAISNISEPMLEMTCLQSLNDVFDAVGYASSGEISPLVGALASAATSYLTQAIPTLGGQAERTSESVRMSTYTEKNAFLTSDMQYAIGRASARVPGFDYNQIPYIDAWGREEQTGAAGVRAANNFVNPAYVSKVSQGDMEKELLRLYDSTGSASVFPSRAAKYFNVDGKRVDLDGETYVKYAKEKGQTAYKGVTALVGNAYYQKLSDEEKAEAVSLVYEYANSAAKQKVSQYKPTGWTAKAQKTIKETGISLDKYILAYKVQVGVESLKDKNGEPIENSASLVKMQAVYQISGINDKQHEALFDDFGVGAKVKHYNSALVNEKLKKMRGK